MINPGSVVLQSWIHWIEFWDRIAAAERARLANERSERAGAAAALSPVTPGRAGERSD